MNFNINSKFWFLIYIFMNRLVYWKILFSVWFRSDLTSSTHSLSPSCCPIPIRKHFKVFACIWSELFCLLFCSSMSTTTLKGRTPKYKGHILVPHDCNSRLHQRSVFMNLSLNILYPLGKISCVWIYIRVKYASNWGFLLWSMAWSSALLEWASLTWPFRDQTVSQIY